MKSKKKAKEILNKLIPMEYVMDEKLYQAYYIGFKDAWKYKEIERRGWESWGKNWRRKCENNA